MIDLAALAVTAWICGRCQVQWSDRQEVPCWNCGSLEAVGKNFPKPYADTCQIDPVFPPVAP